MKQEIYLIHVHFRGHQELKHVYYTFWETQQMNKAKIINQYCYEILLWKSCQLLLPLLQFFFHCMLPQKHSIM